MLLFYSIHEYKTIRHMPVYNNKKQQQMKNNLNRLIDKLLKEIERETKSTLSIIRPGIVLLHSWKIKLSVNAYR